LTIEPAVRELEVDHDTKGVPGSPPIMETILSKIDNAAVFVPDLTFVGKRGEGKPTPNPNVLIEYGWALKSLTHTLIVPIMNTAFGAPTRETMPFDLGSFRYPSTYYCTADCEEKQRSEIRDNLAKTLESKIREVLESAEFKRRMPLPAAPLKFSPRAPEDGLARFKPRDEPIGVLADRIDSPKEIRIPSKPAVWFRMMPTAKQTRSWSVSDLQSAATQNYFVHPLINASPGYNYFRSHEGFGIFGVTRDPREVTDSIVFIFTTGEMWTIDTRAMDTEGEQHNFIPPLEEDFRRTMVAYGKFLSIQLGINPPFKWIAGMEGTKGRGLYVPPHRGYMSHRVGPHGKCQLDVITDEGLYSPGDSPAECLRPFFTKLFNSCGLERPEWLDS